jgi:hypothetical protein
MLPYSSHQALDERTFFVVDLTHKFKIGQSVDLIPSTFRSAAKGSYEIVSLRPPDGGVPQYRIKSQSEGHDRVVSESDLVVTAQLQAAFF